MSAGLQAPPTNKNVSQSLPATDKLCGTRTESSDPPRLQSPPGSASDWLAAYAEHCLYESRLFQ
ncbi:MAG: hypothetical protein SGJ27_27235 [Candidatus Melainabacteria bacterium]|nr:hypothetical protein [Candidatus Melainabacteria bacterium]